MQVLPYADQSAYFAVHGGGARRAFGIRASITGHDSDVQVSTTRSTSRPCCRQWSASTSTSSGTRCCPRVSTIRPQRAGAWRRSARTRGPARPCDGVARLHVGKWDHVVSPGCSRRTSSASRSASRTATSARSRATSTGPSGSRRKLKGLTKTAHAYAAQVQQNPTVRGAGVFRNAKWQFADDYPVDMHFAGGGTRRRRPEGGAQDPDWTAGALGGRDRQGGSGWWTYSTGGGRSAQVEERIRLTARELDPSGTAIYIEEEPGATGQGRHQLLPAARPA